MKKHLLAIPTIVLYIMYTLPWIAYGDSEMHVKPFVYRALTNVITKLLMASGMGEGFATVITVTFFLAMFFISFGYLYLTFFEGENEAIVWSYIATILLLGLFGNWVTSKPYDISTAAIMTLSFALMARGKIHWYIMLFPFACANRETAFLLIIVFAVWYRKHNEILLWLAYQIMSLAVIQMVIRLKYAELEGPDFLWRVAANLGMYGDNPLSTLLLAAGVIILAFVIFRSWHSKPLFLRTVFVITTPLLVVMYFLVGVTFEMRVFIEVYPIIVLLSKGVRDEQTNSTAREQERRTVRTRYNT